MVKNIKKILAKNVKKFRKLKGVTQEEMSLELELDGSYIGKLENANMNITIDKIDKIAKYFGIDTYILIK